MLRGIKDDRDEHDEHYGIPQLFSSPSLGADTGVLKSLTHLDLGSELNDNALLALSQSPYLSNLTTLKLDGGYLSQEELQSSTESTTAAMRAFTQSPFLWSSRLKHLELYHFPSTSYSNLSADLASLLHTLDTANAKLETFHLANNPIPLNLFSTAHVCLNSSHSLLLH